MKVSELIEILQAHDPDGEALLPLRGDDQVWVPVEAVYFGVGGVACVSPYAGDEASFCDEAANRSPSPTVPAG